MKMKIIRELGEARGRNKKQWFSYPVLLCIKYIRHTKIQIYQQNSVPCRGLTVGFFEWWAPLHTVTT